MRAWAKVNVLNSASGQAGSRPQNLRFLHYYQTTLPSNKTNSMSWVWTFKNGKKCDRSKSQIPFAFWLLANPHWAHISLSSHLSASEFVWLSCEWWKLKSYVDMYSMWKTTPRFSLPWKGQRYMYTFLCTQTVLLARLCTHSTSLGIRLKNTEYCVLTWWEATGLVLRHWPRRDGIQPIPRPQEKYFRPQSWLQNILFVGNKMFPALRFFFFF